jgi:hypothetical protein
MGLLAFDPVVVALAIGIPVLGKTVIVLWSLRGTRPEDRPKIIDSVAGLFPATSWSRSRRRRAHQVIEAQNGLTTNQSDPPVAGS